jgi:hypothetical protein
MTLSPHQQQSFVQTANLYAPIAITQTGTAEATDPISSALPTLSGVVCAFYPTTEIDMPQPQGRTKLFNIMTADHWRFEVSVPIQDGWVILLTTPGHPSQGFYWLVEGNPRQRPNAGRRQANDQLVYARRCPKPNGIT